MEGWKGDIFEVFYASEHPTIWEKAKERDPILKFWYWCILGIGSCILAEMLRVAFFNIWPWESSVLYFLVFVIISSNIVSRKNFNISSQGKFFRRPLFGYLAIWLIDWYIKFDDS